MRFYSGFGVLVGLLGGVLAAQTDLSSLQIETKKPADLNALQTDKPTKVSLKQAWDMVLANYDGLKAQDYAEKKAKKLSTAAKLSFLPEIDLSAFYVHLGKPITISPFSGANKAQLQNFANGMERFLGQPALAQMGGMAVAQGIGGMVNTLSQPFLFSKQNIVMGALSIIYPLYMGGERFYMSKLASLAHKESMEVSRLKRLSTFQELVKIYYGLVLNMEVSDVLKGVEQGHLKHYQNALKRLKAGQIAKVEALSAQVAYEKSKTKSMQADDALEVATLAFNTILSSQNIPVSKAHFAPTAHLNIRPKALPSLDFFVQETLSSYPVLRSLAIKKQSAQQMTKLQVAKFLPHFNFFGAYLMKENNSTLMNMIPEWFVGVGARLPILTPNGRIMHYQAAKIDELQTSALQSQAKKDMELLVHKTYLQCQALLKEYKSLDTSVELAKENLKLQEEAFNQGMATNAMVVDARNSLAGILVEQKTHAYKYISALVDLMVLSGHMDSFYDFVY
ncbi:TolC family protein [Helicobacter ailurogastricus]|uniref:Outer membrane protein n=1 Tax=Helicobacter ailurogastricus TaxID=1578720 RepID=A0A0K2XZ13_9HELI|nr:TolC family protein [Helicobacter ailurogastricus]BDQ29452.1 lipase [Helicobacter ailurogastricus]GMB91902.1 Lipase-like protein [Helicobacter ailurogastricus]CRF52326.1 Outer membrane protein [Helicobacter ailurogastricus]